MRTAVLIVTFASAALVSSGDAQADGFYFSEGFGSTTVDNQMSELFDGGGFTARVAIGRRIGAWAVEGYFQGADLSGEGVLDGSHYEAMTVGIDARYLIPVSSNFLVYGRGGLNKMSIDSGGYASDPRYREGSPADDYEGRGISYGAGAQVHGKVRALGLLFWPLFFARVGPKVTASAWLDTSHQFVRLHNPRMRTVDGDLDTWTLGFSLGGDF